DGNVYALNAANGSTRWTAATGERIRATPAVADGGVFVGTAGGKLYRFDRATGKRDWSYATAGASLVSGDFGYDRRTLQSSPAIANGIAYVGARDGQFYAVDAKTGTLRWKSDYGLPWVITSPALQDGRVYIGSSDGHFVQCLNGSDGKELWKTDVGTTVWSSPALSGDLVFAGDGDGRLHAFDRENGTRLWSFMTGGMVMSSPVVARDLVVFGSSDRAVYALRTGSTPVHRVVYAHMAKPEDDATKLVRMLNERGYTTPANGTDVAKFLADRADDRAPSVIVFTNSRLPDEVKPVLRRYLDSGGKVLWIGVPPGVVPNDPEALKTLGAKALDFDAPTRLLGVNHAAVAFDARGTRATAAGRKWGLDGWWRAAWGVPVDQVTEALSLDEWGSTTEWVKAFGGPPGTGFVRARGTDNNALYFMSEYRPSPKPVENRTP
ncbi:MAG: outer membrane protein assembly factor BamB family protein, partial [Thermoanaerobaculia bacterium]